MVAELYGTVLLGEIKPRHHSATSLLRESIVALAANSGPTAAPTLG